MLKWLAHRKTSDVLENFEIFTTGTKNGKEMTFNKFI